MSAFKTYKGGRLDLDHYRGMTISSFEVDVFNDDDTAMDLDVYDDIIVKIYEKIHGTLVITSDFQSGISTDSPAGNTIYWTTSFTSMTIRPKYYWHECYGTKQNGAVKELIYQGVSTVI